ncbi:polyamine ABC transporter substrate-binding protein [Shinella sp. 838]|jgi:putative spermidine/putrescine transport system substrate-binding protein|uniref:polyamine ABC transporter substrate-binding protein n=1 Tax=unclassified Shinella TaxID=2643062 RepID=UPI0003C53FDA|nr:MULTISPECIES: ABC transporter substrate-binding protein [unclassified Shinella]EYR78233.1 spermidine/putrescine-binding periplasmic protein [Shinella sp. DD12]MCA0340006.1 polyamine ABC transporter substrate-binding protein [Pseudomonadota bacterium]MDG4673396.1 polyamine ABC transporter substrate-binding protein [Shinella sp. 838]
MRTRFFAMMASAALVVASPALSRDLTVVGFGGATQEAMRETLFKPYQEKAGAPLLEESYTGGIAKVKAMVETGTTTWDVVQMDENEMILACDQGLLEPFDWAGLPNSADIIAPAKSDCGVGAFVWSKILAYDGDKTSGVTSWADFWNLEKWPGKRGLRKQARMTLEVALLADGAKPEELYDILATKEGQDRAFAKLDAIKPSIQWWESGAQPMEWLASGEVTMTSAYNGRVIAANQQGRHFKMSWTNQLYAMDFWAIPKGGNRDQAFDIVNFMTSPEPQKAFAEKMVYGVTNAKAMDSISADIKPQLPTAEENMVGALAVSTPFWVDHEEELQQRFNRWVAQ